MFWVEDWIMTLSSSSLLLLLTRRQPQCYHHNYCSRLPRMTQGRVAGTMSLSYRGWSSDKIDALPTSCVFDDSWDVEEGEESSCRRKDWW